jgi:hypothetical protein
MERFNQAKSNMTLTSLFLFCLTFPFRKYKRIADKRAILRVESLEDRFTRIYERNAWGSKESVSGSGSTYEMTIPIRRELPILIQKFQIESIFDAPCGDFNWMKLVDLQGVFYSGGDIVGPLIRDLEESYSSETVSFVHIDITKSIFPKSDLVLNRDCLFHLSYLDIFAILQNFIASESKYFLSTSHDNETNFRNSDIASAGFRLIDLFLEPFSFSREYLYKISESGEGALPSRHLYLWNREQVIRAHANLSRFFSQT